MTGRRILVGPVSAEFSANHFADIRSGGDCLTFGRSGADVPFKPGESWSDLSHRLPQGWQPDCVVLNLAYNSLPVDIFAMPVPLIGYGFDWPLHWHYYRRVALHLDRFWTDRRGTELLHAAGIRNARTIVPFGRANRALGPAPESERDVDLVWAGNFNAAIHRDRLPWLIRIARLSDRYRVRTAPGIDPEKLRPWFERSRVAFLPSFQGSWDGLVAEALAAGCLVIRDGSIDEVPGGLNPGTEFIECSSENLESILEHALANDRQRLSVAAGGQARAIDFGTQKLWSRATEEISSEWNDILASVHERVSRAPNQGIWELDHWQALGTEFTATGDSDDPGRELARAVMSAWGDAKTPKHEAADRLRKLLAHPETGVAAALHLGEILVATERTQEAVPFLRRACEAASGRERLSSITLGFGPLRPGFHHFRVEWERAAWQNPGDITAEENTKRALLRARCELLLGRSTDDPARVIRAAQIAPQYLPALESAGPAALKLDEPALAVKFLAQAFSEHPFDQNLPQVLEKALSAMGDQGALARLQQDRKHLSQIREVRASGKVAAQARRERISLTMIVKDEEANLPACLDSVRELVDEMIVVDTGSKDRTVEIASARGARVVHFAWCDNFAAARNAGIDAAQGDWIFWLDADEQLGQSDRKKAQRLFHGLRAENAAYLMRQLSPSVEPGGATTAVDQVRLFRKRPDVRWEYRIHEQILLSIRRNKADVRSTNIVIAHSGYKNSQLCDRKMERNLRLLELAHQEQPTDSVLAFNLAQAYHKAGQAAKALPLLEHCRATLAPQVSIVPKVYRILGQTLERLGRSQDAHATFTSGRRTYPEDVELLLHHGLFLQREKNFQAAEACFRRILEIPKGTYPVGIDLGLLGYKTRNALADLFLEQGRWAEAKDQWLIALAEEPSFVQGRIGLATVAVKQGLRNEAIEILEKLGPIDPIIRPQVARLHRMLANPSVKESH